MVWLAIMVTQEGYSAGDLREILSDTPFITRLGLTALQAHKGLEAGFAVSHYQGGEATYSNVLMPRDSRENEGLDPTKYLGLNELGERFKGNVGPFWGLLIHSHPGQQVGHKDKTQCPSLIDVKLLANVQKNHPGHIGGVLTTAKPPLVLRLILYRSGTDGIDLSQLKDYPGDDYSECTQKLHLAGVRTARIMYAGNLRWFGTPEELFE